MSETEPLPTPPHLASEFYLWFWWASEAQEGVFSLGEPMGSIEAWVDDRLAFRLPGEFKASAIMTGANPSATLESRAALIGGKVLNDLRLRCKRDEREYVFSLRGPEMLLHQAKLPQQVDAGGEGAIFDRMFLYEELHFIITALFQQFCALRASEEWESRVVAQIRQWSAGGD